MNTSDEDTKNTFDFSGESGASDRRSFVEQLENAFQTPAKVDLCYDFGGHLRTDVSPVPSVPVNLSTVATSSRSGDGSGSFGSQLLDIQQPTILNTTRTDKSQTQSLVNLNLCLNLDLISSLVQSWLICLNHPYS